MISCDFLCSCHGHLDLALFAIPGDIIGGYHKHRWHVTLLMEQATTFTVAEHEQVQPVRIAIVAPILGASMANLLLVTCA